MEKSVWESLPYLEINRKEMVMANSIFMAWGIGIGVMKPSMGMGRGGGHWKFYSRMGFLLQAVEEMDMLLYFLWYWGLPSEKACGIPLQLSLYAQFLYKVNEKLLSEIVSFSCACTWSVRIGVVWLFTDTVILSDLFWKSLFVYSWKKLALQYLL